MAAETVIDLAEVRKLSAVAFGANGHEEPLPPALEVPLRILPPTIAAYIGAAAAAIPVPAGMVLMPFLSYTGALIGNRMALEVKRGWPEYPILWVGLIGEPGDGKTAAINYGRAPLGSLQHLAITVYTEQLAQYQTDLDDWNARPKAERGARPEAPQLRHYFTTNATLEALTDILRNSHGVAITKDELLGLITGMDQYRGGKGADRQEYLALWSGGTIKADRVGRTIYAPHPVAGIVGGIQPDLMLDLQSSKGKRDGLIERFSPWRYDVDEADWTEADVDPALLAPVVDVYRQLDRLPAFDPEKPNNLVYMSQSARSLWEEWYNQNQDMIRDATGLRKGFYRKLRNHVARFALILSALWNPDNPMILISPERMADAIELGEIGRAHIERTLPLLGITTERRATGLIARLRRVLSTSPKRNADGWISRAQIADALRNVDADAVLAGLEHLEREREAERRTVQVTRPAEQWRLIPQAWPDRSPNGAERSMGDRLRSYGSAGRRGEAIEAMARETAADLRATGEDAIEEFRRGLDANAATLSDDELRAGKLALQLIEWGQA